MFEITRIKLTAWYLMIIMIISLLFSLIIYSMINVEFVNIERRQTEIRKNIDTFMETGSKRNAQIIFYDVNEARLRLISRLALINLGIFVFAGGAGYFLAGRTLKPIKKTLEEQNRFISDSSHELRTPLTSLRSEIEVTLMNKKLTLRQAKDTLNSNLDEVIRLQSLSDRLLELAQGDEKIVQYNFNKEEISQIINISIENTKQLASKKNISIKYNPKKNVMKGDSKRLAELFTILIDNAIKYSPKNETIHINTKKGRGNLKIEIVDNGIGIAKNDLKHIFDRFYRAEKSRNEDGFGLGLSIAKKIAEDHGGQIKARNNSKKGSTFIVTLPA